MQTTQQPTRQRTHEQIVRDAERISAQAQRFSAYLKRLHKVGRIRFSPIEKRERHFQDAMRRGGRTFIVALELQHVPKQFPAGHTNASRQYQQLGLVDGASPYGDLDVTLCGERIGSIPKEDAAWIRPLMRIGHVPKVYLDDIVPGEGYKGKTAVTVIVAHFDEGIRAYEARHAEAPAGYGIRPGSAIHVSALPRTDYLFHGR